MRDIKRLLKRPVSEAKFQKILASLCPYEKDLLFECGRCGVEVGEPCLDIEKGLVHVGRRIRRLLNGIR